MTSSILPAGTRVKFGVDFIHEPVMSGALPSNAENLTVFAQNPTDYLGNPQQFAVDLNCTPTATLQVTAGTTCTSTPAGNGSFRAERAAARDCTRRIPGARRRILP